MPRGRPKKIINESIENPPMIFNREYKVGGVRSIWKYNLNISLNPIEVENIYPKGYMTEWEKIEEKNKSLPLTKRQFFNEENGKFVSYQRAKSLNLI